MTLGEWDKSIEALGTEQLKATYEALSTLKRWPDLHREYKWTGLWVHQTSILYELLKRGEAERCPTCGEVKLKGTMCPNPHCESL